MTSRMMDWGWGWGGQKERETNVGFLETLRQGATHTHTHTYAGQRQWIRRRVKQMGAVLGARGDRERY